MKNCKLLKLNGFVEFKVLVTIFKAKHNSLRKTSFRLLKICNGTQQYSKLNYAYVRITLNNNYVSGVRLWNGLNGELSHIASI